MSARRTSSKEMNRTMSTVAEPEVSGFTPATQTLRGMIGCDILYPEPNKRYYWAAEDPMHPQSVRMLKLMGYMPVTPDKAEKLGLDAYKDKVLFGNEPVPDVNNCIRYGNLILMECSEETWVNNALAKEREIQATEGIAEELGASEIEDSGGVARRY